MSAWPRPSSDARETARASRTRTASSSGTRSRATTDAPRLAPLTRPDSPTRRGRVPDRQVEGGGEGRRSRPPLAWRPVTRNPTARQELADEAGPTALTHRDQLSSGWGQAVSVRV